uniref:Uncharacterized protein n=1 Tax=Panagrolaimus sp. JU765 TaxID=591449 RepID=A0AC34PVB4_9BILA
MIPKNAIENMSFIITNTRGNDYNIGTTYEPFKEFLNRLKNERGVELNMKNCTYCIDNEAFRFQLAMKTSPEFKKNDYGQTILEIISDCWKNKTFFTFDWKQFKRPSKVMLNNYEKSWNQSKKEIQELFKNCFKNVAKPAQDFTFLNDSRILISCFLTISAIIVSFIENSMTEKFLQDYRQNLLNGFEKKIKLKYSKLSIPMTENVNVEIDEIKQLLEDLFEMKPFGKQIQEAYELEKSSNLIDRNFEPVKMKHFFID